MGVKIFWAKYIVNIYCRIISNIILNILGGFIILHDMQPVNIAYVNFIIKHSCGLLGKSYSIYVYFLVVPKFVFSICLVPTLGSLCSLLFTPVF